MLTIGLHAAFYMENDWKSPTFCKTQTMRLTPLPPCFLADELRTESDDNPDRLIAPFALIGETQTLLREWKKRPSSRIEKSFFSSLAFRAAIEEMRQLTCDAIVPIPQRLERAYRMNGGPVNRLTLRLSRELSIPVLDELSSFCGHHSPQGQKTGVHRYLNSREYRWNPAMKMPDRVLLVDDFWTSGHTVRAATRALRRERCEQVVAFVLGYRPYLEI